MINIIAWTFEAYKQTTRTGKVEVQKRLIYYIVVIFKTSFFMSLPCILVQDFVVLLSRCFHFASILLLHCCHVVCKFLWYSCVYVIFVLMSCCLHLSSILLVCCCLTVVMVLLNSCSQAVFVFFRAVVMSLA